MSHADHGSLVETRLDSEKVFDGTLLHVRRDRVALPNGKETSREYIRHPGASVIVPVMEDGRLLLERQYRYPIQKTLIEFPAGKIDTGETPYEAARRELIEETGFDAEVWHELGAICPVPAYSDEFIYCFVAERLVRRDVNPDEDEIIECVALTAQEVAQKIRSGEIFDAKTICAFYYWQVLQEERRMSR